jgi:predicted ArsR family transcriptional regulator
MGDARSTEPDAESQLLAYFAALNGDAGVRSTQKIAAVLGIPIETIGEAMNHLADDDLVVYGTHTHQRPCGRWPSAVGEVQLTELGRSHLVPH